MVPRHLYLLVDNVQLELSDFISHYYFYFVCIFVLYSTLIRISGVCAIQIDIIIYYSTLNTPTIPTSSVRKRTNTRNMGHITDNCTEKHLIIWIQINHSDLFHILNFSVIHRRFALSSLRVTTSSFYQSCFYFSFQVWLVKMSILQIS